MNPLEQVVEALKAAIHELPNPCDSCDGMACDTARKVRAALAELERWKAVEGLHTDDGEFRATQMRCLPAGPAILLVRKEADNG